MKTFIRPLPYIQLFTILSCVVFSAFEKTQAQTTYNQATTSLFATGTNLIEQVATTNTATAFRAAVATAWTNGTGGVFDLPTTVANATTLFRGTYGTNSAKRMQMVTSTGMQNSLGSGGSFYPISNPNLATSTANQSDFNFGLSVVDATSGLILPSEIINQVGFAILARTATAYPLDVVATAAFSDGSTQSARATIGNIRGASDTFYGFTAPSGLSITNVRLQSFATNTTTPVADRIGWDDFGFITGPAATAPAPQIVGLVPAPYAIAVASNGFQFQALTYISINPTNVSVVINSNDVSGSLVFSGNSTNYTVSYAGLVPNQTYNATITVTTAGGTNVINETFYTLTNTFTLYNSGGFTDDTLYPAGSLTAVTNGNAYWTPDPSEPAQIINVGDPQDKVLQRQNTGATRSDVLTFSPVSSGQVIIEFDAFVSTTSGRTLDLSLSPTNAGLMASFLSWGQVSGQLAYYDNTNWNGIATLPSDWHHCKIVNFLSGTAAGKYDVYLNGTLVGQKLAWRTAISGQPMNHLRFETVNTGPVLEYGNVDNLVVTAAPEDTNTTLIPQIINFSTVNHGVIKPTDGVTFNVTSGQSIAGTNISASLDGVDISGTLSVSGPGTNLLATLSSVTTGSHVLNISAFNVAGTNTNSISFIATTGAYTLFDSGGFSDSTLYPVGALQAFATNGYQWTPATNAAQIVDLGAPQGKILQRSQVGSDSIDLLKFPSVASGIVTIDFDAMVSEIDLRTLDVCLMQDTGGTMASFLGWGTVTNQFAYYSGAAAAWIGLSIPGTNWHHFTTINYMSGTNTRTFDVLVDGVVVGAKLPFRQTIAVGTPVGQLRIAAIRGTAPGSYGDMDNLVITAKPLSPLPAPVTISSYGFTSNHFRLTFPTQSGYTHSIQYKNSLSDATWTVLQSFTGNGSTTNITDTTATTSSRYYRVQTTQ